MKRVKSAMLISCIFFISGAVLFSTGKAKGVAKYLKGNEKVSSKSNEVVLEKTRIDKTGRLEVDMKHLDLYIRKSKDNNYYMEYIVQKTKKKNPLSCTQDGQTLVLSEKNGKIASYYREINFGTGISLPGAYKTEEFLNTVILYLPEDAVLEECNISLKKGDAEIQLLNAKTLDCTLKNGDFSVNKLAAGSGNINTGDGDIDCGKISLSGNLSLKSTDGDISCGIAAKDKGSICISGSTMDGEIEASKKYKGKIYKKRGDRMYYYLAGNSKKGPKLSIYTKYGDLEIN